jgi:hypothetical protein
VIHHTELGILHLKSIVPKWKIVVHGGGKVVRCHFGNYKESFGLIL